LSILLLQWPSRAKTTEEFQAIVQLYYQVFARHRLTVAELDRAVDAALDAGGHWFPAVGDLVTLARPLKSEAQREMEARMALMAERPQLPEGEEAMRRRFDRAADIRDSIKAMLAEKAAADRLRPLERKPLPARERVDELAKRLGRYGRRAEADQILDGIREYPSTRAAMKAENLKIVLSAEEKP
jgi:hypothetical protein